MRPSRELKSWQQIAAVGRLRKTLAEQQASLAAAKLSLAEEAQRACEQARAAAQDGSVACLTASTIRIDMLPAWHDEARRHEVRAHVMARDVATQAERLENSAQAWFQASLRQEMIMARCNDARRRLFAKIDETGLQDVIDRSAALGEIP